MTEPSETASNATTVCIVQGEGVRDGEHAQDARVGDRVNIIIMEDLRMDEEITLESGVVKKTQLDGQTDGI